MPKVARKGVACNGLALRPIISASERRYADPRQSAKATHSEAHGIDCGASRTRSRAGLSDDPAQRQPTVVEYFDYLNRLAALEATLRANGQWFFPHPWLTTFIGDSQVESVVNAELAAVNPAADLGPLGQVVLSPIRRSAISSPLLRMPSEELCFALNLIRVPATEDADAANRLVDANKATYGRVKAAGGSLYPVSALPLSRGEWRDHFGSAVGQLDAAKQDFDPDKILTPGYAVFQ